MSSTEWILDEVGCIRKSAPSIAPEPVGNAVQRLSKIVEDVHTEIEYWKGQTHRLRIKENEQHEQVKKLNSEVISLKLDKIALKTKVQNVTSEKEKLEEQIAELRSQINKLELENEKLGIEGKKLLVVNDSLVMHCLTIKDVDERAEKELRSRIDEDGGTDNPPSTATQFGDWRDVALMNRNNTDDKK
ncbi:hypothetical protein BDN72DRAFT_957659 [Pluteus cervinus]|uniref:Uncharacterized protein n=1 Tax=Pluteus cervinus TaxID=181527 RepID=A0ACD3B2A1_9AGAR|nr:hypothetical protein BDN72DRAFT_957659 [Pluteus cervinus]